MRTSTISTLSAAPLLAKVNLTTKCSSSLWTMEAMLGCAAYIRDILIRQTKKPPAPGRKAKKRAKRLESTFDGERDAVAEQLHAGNAAATSDEEKLYYCLKYAHHKSGRKRGDESLETIVRRAPSLPGGRPAKRFYKSNPPRNWGLCLQCGALIYPENLIPGTNFHNCRVMRELLRQELHND